MVLRIVVVERPLVAVGKPVVEALVRPEHADTAAVVDYILELGIELAEDAAVPADVAVVGTVADSDIVVADLGVELVGIVAVHDSSSGPGNSRAACLDVLATVKNR